MSRLISSRIQPGACKPAFQKRSCGARKMAGFTYMEVIIATALILVSLVPALDALSVGTIGSGIHESTTMEHYNLYGKMEEVLAVNYFVLAAEARAVNDPYIPTSWSDSVALPTGRTLVRQVYLYGYDADNNDADNDHFTGIDAGLLWTKVELEGTGRSLERLIHVH